MNKRTGRYSLPLGLQGSAEGLTPDISSPSAAPSPLKAGVIAAAIWLACTEATQAASVIELSAATYSVTEGVGRVEIAVQRANDLEGTVSVVLATAGLTATPGLDYIDVVTNLTFAAAETNRTVVVPILNDGAVEAVESFQVSLSNPVDGAVLGTRTNSTVRITDNDKGIQFELANYSVSEDIGTARVRVLRGDDGDFPLSVDYAASGVTALPGQDYVELGGTLTFAPGETLNYLSIVLLNDRIREVDKTLRLTLSNPSIGAFLQSPTAAQVTITDTDDVIRFAASNLSIPEDAASARVLVTRGENQSAATVTVNTADITAVSGQDYVGLTNTLHFEPGERAKAIDVPILNDGLKESPETFRVVLSSAEGGAALGRQQNLTVTILDNDPGTGFESRDYSVWEKLPGVELNVVRGNDAWSGPFTIGFQTADGTARAGVDYQTASGTLNFGENEMVKGIPIHLLRDHPSGTRRVFTVTLSNSDGQVPLGTTTATINIADASQGFVQRLQPPLVGAIEQAGSLVQVSWPGPAILSLAHSVSGPWRQAGPVDAPFLSAPERPATYYRLASPRPARVYLPSGYDGQSPLPLILVLHGYGQDASWMEGYFTWRPWAESRRLILCYPDGTLDRFNARFWNATDACCDLYGAGTDDSAYLRGLIEDLIRRFSVDRKRIYVTGLSNGGFMSHRMACDHADLIAGIASLAGVTFLDPNSHPPSQPVNVLHIAGTSDATVPYGGGKLGEALPTTALIPGAVRTMRTWGAFNGSKDEMSDTTATLDLDSGVSGRDTTVTRYTTSPPGGAVELWTIRSGSHVPNLTTDFHERVLSWLLDHPKP